MAITRTQIAKQLLAQGGRTGFRIGSDEGDVSGREYGGSSKGNQNTGGPPGGGDKGMTYTAPPSGGSGDNRERGMEQSRLEAQRRSDLKSLARRNAEEKLEERLERFRKLGSNTRKFQQFVQKFSPFAMFASRFGPLNTRDFFIDKVLGSKNFSNITREQFANLTEEEKEDMFGDYMSDRMSGATDAYGNPISRDRDGPPILIPPITAQAPSITEEELGYVNPLSKLTPRIAGTRFLGTELENEDEDKSFDLRLAGGGIASLDDMDREGFVLGGIAKGLKKAVRGIKKLAKSPIGKAALGFAAFQYGGGLGGIMDKFNKLSTLQKVGLGIGATSLAAGAMTPKEDKFDIDSYYASGQTGDVEPFPRIAGSKFDFYGGRMPSADGGRIEYQEGSKEPVAKKTMPLLDMDGMEKDYREDGGFVPIGRMEKADDVPARLSKNEFVFTADAVRNAGDGDVDKGAEVMYNMMKNLESGGEVSEESQGLEGARKMFQTSQRLEEVL